MEQFNLSCQERVWVDFGCLLSRDALYGIPKTSYPIKKHKPYCCFNLGWGGGGGCFLGRAKLIGLWFFYLFFLWWGWSSQWSRGATSVCWKPSRTVTGKPSWLDRALHYGGHLTSARLMYQPDRGGPIAKVQSETFVKGENGINTRIIILKPCSTDLWWRSNCITNLPFGITAHLYSIWCKSIRRLQK